MSARLDAELAARGLARSRTHAARLVADGRVTIDGVIERKSSTKVAVDQRLDVDADQYVSRAAHKLIAALDVFDIDVTGRTALDMGASTGGFTQVLRERGADPVLAVDVGHDQIAPDIAADPGVRVVEGFNVRFMTPAALAEASGIADPPRIVTGDLSFISLRHVLPAAVEVASPDADLVLLVKPQFEVGRTNVRGGIVEDPALRAQAVRNVLAQAADLGCGTLGVIPSPITGTHGNAEAVVHIGRGRGSDPTEWEDEVVGFAQAPPAPGPRGGR
ncbi:TlyA family RNA methyltransferase [Microbacterium sp. G2-8]|uniref:TlyA family RNA methyltransferase n=1 Tax=Microbacterium sp. G2-8 TaxID=2842454 RepID=UPI001C8A23CD|nr:TlyA family RNA methyltransferase [Microbacterium sp. G2-8]